MLPNYVARIKAASAAITTAQMVKLLTSQRTPLCVRVYNWTEPGQGKIWRRTAARLATPIRPWWAKKFKVQIDHDTATRAMNERMSAQMRSVVKIFDELAKKGPQPMKPSSTQPIHDGYEIAAYGAMLTKPPAE